MKYIKQLGIILTISFIGEILNHFIPLPIPASIYGLVLMFVCLQTGIIKLDAVKDTADFLIEIMPMMFIPAAVGLIESWEIIQPNALAYVAIAIVSTITVMFAAGHITQFIIRRSKKEGEK